MKKRIITSILTVIMLMTSFRPLLLRQTERARRQVTRPPRKLPFISTSSMAQMIMTD